MAEYLIGQGLKFSTEAYEDIDDADPIPTSVYTLYITLPDTSEIELPDATHPMRLQGTRYIIEYTPPLVGNYEWYWQMIATADAGDDSANRGTFSVYGRNG